MSDPPFTPPFQLGGLGITAVAPVSHEDALGGARAPPGLASGLSGGYTDYQHLSGQGFHNFFPAQRPAPPTEPPPRPPPGPPPPPPLVAGAAGGPLHGPMIFGLLGPGAPVAVEEIKRGDVNKAKVGAIGPGKAPQQSAGQGNLGKPIMGGVEEDPKVEQHQRQRLPHQQQQLPQPPAPPQQHFQAKVGDRSGRQPVRENLTSWESSDFTASHLDPRPHVENAQTLSTNDKPVQRTSRSAGRNAVVEDEVSTGPFMRERQDSWDSPRPGQPPKEEVVQEAPRPATPSARTPPGSENRMDLVRSLFRACDDDGDGWLNEKEMRNFAVFFGFQGSDEDWGREYRILCSEKGAYPSKGIGPTLFSDLVHDRNPGGLHCEDDDLKFYLRKSQERKSKGYTSAPRTPVGRKDGTPGGGKGDRDPDAKEEDEFYAKLKRTINWYNKHGGLPAAIRLAEVHEEMAQIRPGQAMKILYDLDVAKEQKELSDPTGWIVEQAKKRKEANETQAANPNPRPEKGEGRGKGEGREGKGERERSYTDADRGERRGRSTRANSGEGPPPGKGSGKGKGKSRGGGGDEDGEGAEDNEFTSKMRRTVNWYNRHGGLLAPIRFEEIVSGLSGTDPRVAMRILNDLDQANAEGVLNDPTKWILEEHRRRVQSGEKGNPQSPNSKAPGHRANAGGASEPPQPKPGALSKLGGLTSMPLRLGPPKKPPTTP